MSDGYPSSPFWDFSISYYAEPSVATTCLRLQERHGIDVNLLLFCLWRTSLGQSLSAADLDQIRSSVQSWHDNVVRTLRHVRSELKADSYGVDRRLADSFRNSVKDLELNAERIEQLFIENLASKLAQSIPMPFAELVEELPGNLRLLGVSDQNEDQKDIDILIAALETWSVSKASTS